MAYEKGHMSAEALAAYIEVFGWNPAFREVAQKIESLKKGTAPAPEKPADSKRTSPPKGGSKSKSRVSYI